MLGRPATTCSSARSNTDGKVFRIDPMTGSATAGRQHGRQFTSSGDLVAVDGFGTVQTVTGCVAPISSRGSRRRRSRRSPIGSGTGFAEIWGVAFWKGKVYGFTNGGQFVLIDPTTGDATMVTRRGHQWWGAAVTTLAPVLQ